MMIVPLTFPKHLGFAGLTTAKEVILHNWISPQVTKCHDDGYSITMLST